MGDGPPEGKGELYTAGGARMQYLPKIRHGVASNTRITDGHGQAQLEAVNGASETGQDVRS